MEFLKKEAAKKDHERSQRTKTAASMGITVCIFFFCLAVAWSIGVLSFHYLFPEEWRYLSTDQISKIQGFLGVALLSGLLADYAKKLMA